MPDLLFSIKNKIPDRIYFFFFNILNFKVHRQNGWIKFLKWGTDFGNAIFVYFSLGYNIYAV